MKDDTEDGNGIESAHGDLSQVSMRKPRSKSVSFVWVWNYFVVLDLRECLGQNKSLECGKGKLW